MTELDRDLQRALSENGRRWRPRLDEPEELDRMVGAAVATAQRGRVRRLAALVAAAVVASLTITIAAVYPRGHSGAPATRSVPVPPLPPPGIAAAVVIRGKSTPYAGTVPWLDATSDPANPRRLYVMADNDNIDATVAPCGVAADRVTVTESSNQVRVLIAGYAVPLQPGASCAAVGNAPVRTGITLRQPLADRTLIDITTGRSHSVLNPAVVVPDAHDIPAACATTFPLTWDEHTGVAERAHIASGGSHCDLRLHYGPTAAVEVPSPAHDGVTPCPAVRLASELAKCWHFHDRYRGTGYILRWRPTPTAAILLEIAVGAGRQLTRDEATAIANSIK